jgi:hypothetical protein
MVRGEGADSPLPAPWLYLIYSYFLGVDKASYHFLYSNFRKLTYRQDFSLFL